MLGGEKTLDVARSLTDAVLVLDQRDAHIIVAVLAKADTRRDGHIGLLDQKLGEFKRTQRAEAFRDRNPGKHGRSRRWNIPACPTEAFDQHVTTLLIDIAHIGDIRAVAIEYRRPDNLDRRERAITKIGTYAPPPCNQSVMADPKAHALPPPG